MAFKGIRSAIKLIHKGCVKCELSEFLALEKHRPDLELASYLLRRDKESYRILLVIRSMENEVIDETLEEEIRDFLYDHKLVRAFKPNLPRPCRHQIYYLALIQDVPESPGTIRIIASNGGWFNPTIGTRILKGEEDITFFVTRMRILGRIMDDFIDHSDIYEVLGLDVGENYRDLDDIIKDPYYLIATLVCNVQKAKPVLENIKKKRKDLLESIDKHAWWLIPLFAEILRWSTGYEGPPTSYVV